MMEAKEMLNTVQVLKEQCVLNGFQKPEGVDSFFADNWMQILDILDDAIYAHLQR